MAQPPVYAGSSSVTVSVFIQDSSSTVGTGLNGLTNATSNLKAFYSRQRAGSTSIGFASLASASAGWTSGGFIAIDTVGMVGWYRFDLPDAVCAVGSPFADLNLYGATNMAQCPVLIPITAVDPQDSVRFGMTALPNAAAAASGGLIINGANSGSGSASMTWNGDLGGRVLGNTTTAYGANTGAQVNVIQTDSVTYRNYDGTLSSATTGSSVSFPLTDALGNAIPDSGQFAYHELEINGGTGAGQRVLLTTSGPGARQYAVLSGTFPTGADSTSTYVMHDNWRANTVKLNGTDQTARDIGASVLLSVGVGTGQVNLSSGKVPATLASTDVTGNVAADVQTIKTQAVTCSAGVTVNVNVGTTQPLNFTGSAGSALVKTDMVDIAGSAVSTTSAQIGVNVVNAAGTAWLSGAITAASIAADADAEIAAAVWDLATAGHTTSGTFGAAMVAAGSAGDPWATSLPGSYGAGTAGHLIGTAIPDIAPGSAGGLLRSGTNTSTTFAALIASITGSLSGSVGSIATGGIAAGSFAAGAIDATAFAQAAADKVWLTGSRTITDKIGFSLSSTGADAITIDGKTLPVAVAIIAGQVAGKISGAGTGTETFIGLNGTTTRAIVTVDSSGNRTAVTYP